MVEHHLIIHEVHQLVSTQIVQFEIEVVRMERVGNRFVLRVVKLCEKGVFKGTCYVYPLFRVDNQHLFEQVEG